MRQLRPTTRLACGTLTMAETVRMLRVAAGVVLVAIVATGCTSERNGTLIEPGATGSSQSNVNDPPTSVSPTNDATYGAPRVSQPLDAAQFLKQPCAVLTEAQLARFGVSRPGEPDTDSEIAKTSGPGCLWHASPTVDSTLGMSFLTGNKRGLSDTYRGRSRFKFFEETTVEGYPAVFNDLSDGRPDGQCNITVGISDTLAFRAREEGGLVGQAVCDRAKQVAAAVIATLKAGA
jgi:hypothetical protein